jgi:hypothetical protein
MCQGTVPNLASNVVAAVHPEVIDGHPEYLDRLVQLTPGLFGKHVAEVGGERETTAVQPRTPAAACGWWRRRVAFGQLALRTPTSTGELPSRTPPGRSSQ